MAIENPQIAAYKFLKEMFLDDYYPTDLVVKGRDILVQLCEQIESKPPKDLHGLYQLTHAATEEFNELAGEFEENDSEIETVARETIGADFSFIASSYGFKDADIEELIAPRDW